MNKLIILSVLQLGMTGAVLYVLLDRGSELPVKEPAQFSIGRTDTVHEVRSVASNESVDAATVREIVRSELSAQLSGLAAGEGADAGDIDPYEKDLLLSEARKRMAIYLAVGEISDREINEFQRKISTLDVATQTAMLSELFREINAGNVNVSY